MGRHFLTWRIFAISFVILICNQALANRASLCRVGATFKKYDVETEILSELLKSGATLATEPALCQLKNGERFVVIQFNPSARASFAVIRAHGSVDEARIILRDAGYSL